MPDGRGELTCLEGLQEHTAVIGPKQWGEFPRAIDGKRSHLHAARLSARDAHPRV